MISPFLYNTQIFHHIYHSDLEPSCCGVFRQEGYPDGYKGGCEENDRLQVSLHARPRCQGICFLSVYIQRQLCYLLGDGETHPVSVGRW